MRTSIVVILGVMASSCSHMKAENQTVDEHRNEAEIHLAKARQEQAQADPSQPMRAAPRAPGSVIFGQADSPFEPYLPADEHMQAADRELAEANAHLVAAKSLEKFEDQACEGVSAGERASCPLFASAVRRVDWVKDGFKLTFKQSAEAATTFPRLRCHLAYAVASGFEQPSCPLFLKGTTLRQEGADGIIFASESLEVAVALRAQARRIFPASKTALR